MARETREADIRYVCAHMREVDAEEQFETRFPSEDEPGNLARAMIAAMPLAILNFCFTGPDGNPATILAAYQQSPGVAKLHRISTDAWPVVSREVFRFGLNTFMPALAAGVHRAECSVLSRYAEASDILQRLGFHREGLARARGRNKRDFVDYAWVRGDV